MNDFNYILDWFISITLLFLIFSNQTTRKLVSSSIMSHKHESVHHFPRIHVSQQGYYHCLLILKHTYYCFDWPLTFIQQGCSLEFSCFLVSVWIVSYGAFILKSQSLIPIDWETPGWTSAAGTLSHQNSGFSVGFCLPWLSDLSRCRGQRWFQYLINCLRSSWHICSVFLWKASESVWSTWWVSDYSGRAESSVCAAPKRDFMSLSLTLFQPQSTVRHGHSHRYLIRIKQCVCLLVLPHGGHRERILTTLSFFF